jgi:hypothetical protein
MSKPIRLRMGGQNAMVTIPKRVLEEAKLSVGMYFDVEWNAELGCITMKLAVISGYKTQAENKQIYSKHDREIERRQAWLAANPNATIGDYFKQFDKKKKEVN